MKCSIKVSKLKVKLNGRVILNNINFTLKDGEVLSIIGPNGAGKTTLLRVLAGIITNYEGLVNVCGYDPKRNPPRIVSYVPSSLTIDPWSRVIDALTIARYGLGGRYSVSKEDFTIILNVAKRLGIEHLLNRYFGSLSSGEAKLVMIATALVRNPKVLLMDEPLTYLDLRNQAKVIRLIRDLVSKGLIVVLVSHELHLIPPYSNKVMLLNKGSIVAYGKPEDVLKKELVESIYRTKLYSIDSGERSILLPSP